MAEEKNQYTNVKRPTVTFSVEEHKEIAHFCIEHGIKIGEFLRTAALYCMDKGINPVKEDD